MKGLKKRMALFTMAAALLAGGCGAKEESSLGTGAQGGEEERITLRIWSKEYDGLDLDTCLMTQVLEEKFNVDLVFETYSSAADDATAFNLSTTSGDYPDIYMSLWLSPALVTSCAQNGVFIPLNDYIFGEEETNYKKALEENSGWEDMVTSNDGNIYTFFYNDTGVHKASEYKMWYREDWLDALGWQEPPKTPEEFKEYLIAIRDNDVNGNGDASDEIPLMGYYGGRQTDPICFLMNPFELYTNNFYYITDEGQVHFSAITDEWREGLAYIADLYSEGLIAEETYVQDGSTFRGILNKDGQDALVGVFPSWYNGIEIDTSVMSWFTYEALAPLAGEHQQTAARLGGSFNLIGAISSQCEHPDKAFELLDYLVGEEGSRLGMWGVEGETYEVADAQSYSGEDTSVTYTVDSITPYLWNNGFFPRYDTEEMRYAFTMDEATIETDNTYVLVHAAEIYQPYYVNHHLPDVVWCSDEEVTQAVADYASLIGTYIKTMDTEFIMGKLDIHDDAAWQAYLDELDRMGLEDYINKLYTYYDLEMK